MICELCRDEFLKIYRDEIQHGNSIRYISVRPALLCVHMDKVLRKHQLTKMQYFEMTDCHYPLEKGYCCPQCRTSISSPLKKDQKDQYAVTAKHIITPEEMLARIASGELKAEDGSLFSYNTVNPKVIVKKDALIFDDGWEEYLYWAQDWQVIPTITY